MRHQPNSILKMKKLIPILLLAFISQMSYANGTPEGDNSGGDDKGEKGHPHKSPKVTPCIFCNQGILSITTPYTIYDAEIIIRNSQGDILYDVVDTIFDNYAILLTEYISMDMYSIELVSSGSHFIIYI